MNLSILRFLLLPLFVLSVNIRMLKAADERNIPSIDELLDVHSQVVEAEHNANISCVSTSLVKSDLIFSDIKWKFREKRKDKWGEITDSDKSAIFPHSTYESDNNILSVLTLHNVTMSESGEYLCCIGITICRPICKIFLKVGYPPPMPVMENDVDSCITSINDYQVFMECCWVIGQSTYIDTFYNLTYFTQQSEHSTKKCTEEKSSKMCCNLEVKSRYETVYMYLTAFNKYGSSASNESQVIPSLHVKPPPPKNVTLETSNVTNSIMVKWTHPNVAGIYEYDFKIRYAKQETNIEWKEMYATSQECFELDDLRSQTHYLVDVANRPQSINGVVGGIWSDWSQDSVAVTGLIVPMKQFTFDDVYTIISYTGQDFIVHISWFPYDNQKESGFFNQILYEERSDGKPTLKKIKRTVEITNGQEYSFSVSYLVKMSVCGSFCNNAGCSRKQCREIDSDEAPAPVNNVSISSINENVLTATWNPGPEDQLHCIIRICANKPLPYSQDSRFMNITDECGTPNNSLMASTNVPCTAGTKTINGKWSTCFEYFVVVETVTDTFTVLSTPSTFASYEPSLTSLKFFNVHDASTINSFMISVQWPTVATCYNTNLTILYRPISGSEYQTSSSTSSFQKNVGCEENNTVISEDIFGYTRYLVKLAFLCDGKPLTDLKNGVGEVETRIGEPNAPSKLSLSLGDSPILKWNPPEHKNGNSYYRIIRKATVSKITEEFITEEEEELVSLDCNNGQTETLSFSVYAVNQLASGFLVSSNSSSLEDVHCVTVIENEDNTTNVALGICIPVFLIILMVFLGCLFKRRFKLGFFTKIWPDVPKPSIVITMDCSDANDKLKFHDEYATDIENLFKENPEKIVKMVTSKDLKSSCEEKDENNKFEDEGIADDMSGVSSTSQYGCRSQIESNSSESVEPEYYAMKSEESEDLGYVWDLQPTVNGETLLEPLIMLPVPKRCSTNIEEMKFKNELTRMYKYLPNHHVGNRSHSFSSSHSPGYHRHYVKFSHELREESPFLSPDVDINENSGTETFIDARRNSDAKSKKFLAFKNSQINFSLPLQSGDKLSTYKLIQSAGSITAIKQAFKNYWSFGDLNQVQSTKNAITSSEGDYGHDFSKNIGKDNDQSERSTDALDGEDLDIQMREFLDTIKIPIVQKQHSNSVTEDDSEKSATYVAYESFTKT